MATQPKSAVERLRHEAQMKFENELNKHIVEQLARRDPALLDELAEAAAREMSNPKPKRVRATPKPAQQDAVVAPGADSHTV